MSNTQWAHSTDYSFVRDLMSFGEDYDPQVGERIMFEPSDWKTADGEPFPKNEALIVAQGEDTWTLRDTDTGKEYEVEHDGWVTVRESPTIARTWTDHLARTAPDGVAFADGAVDAALVAGLRAGVQALIDGEAVDYHPGSGTKVRDLVHPSLYPYIEGRSTCLPGAAPSAAGRPNPTYDRFGRAFESSKYQWLPTPFRIDAQGNVSIDAYINTLARARHGALYGHLASLFAVALPLFESVVGYIDQSRFWCEDCEDIEHEGELPEQITETQDPVKPTSLRGRELLVIPKIVEYRLGAGETHEGVWHVEGMSHEHIVATCVYVLDRDDALLGGDLQFKRAYTVEEAGLLFWNIAQCRPLPVEEMVEEGTIPLGHVATPAGRLLVFPNSHIHKLNELHVAAGHSEARRRVIVFWLVDPNVQIPSTRDVAPQQGTIPREEALTVRLALMEERKRHKQSLNVRAVSLCEH